MIDGTGLTFIDFCSIRAMSPIMNARGQGLGLSHTAPATLVLLHLAASIVQLKLHALEFELKHLRLKTVGISLCSNAGNL